MRPRCQGNDCVGLATETLSFGPPLNVERHYCEFHRKAIIKALKAKPVVRAIGGADK